MLTRHFRSPDLHLLRTVIINAITLGVGTGLILNRRNNREIAPKPWPEERDAPRVHVIIPARNEERNIKPLLESLLAQRYPDGRWGITLVDDGSTDRSFEAAIKLSANHGSLSVVQAPPLPEGWTGKSHALYTGLRTAPADCDWLLFVDADTRHHPLTLASVIQRAEESGSDLLSLIIKVEMESFWERLLVPQVGELYTLLVGTMDQVNSESNAAAANGQFLLIRRALYDELAARLEVRGDVAEDRALAAAVKSRGGKVRLEYGTGLVSARVYSSLGDMWSGYAKTLFWASGHDTRRAILVVAALALYAMLPPVALGATLLNARTNKGRALKHAALQLGPMLAVRALVCRRLGIPLAYALTYPLAVTAGDALLLYSVYRVRSGKGVRWKGRTYR